ncbi:MAG: hypothetical protein ACKO96_42530, partial [Flammeovirgaceae bacterium]
GGSILGGSSRSTFSGRFNTPRKEADEEFFKLLVLSYKMNNLKVFPKVMEVFNITLLTCNL